jgi:hypothetical protein
MQTRLGRVSLLLIFGLCDVVGHWACHIVSADDGLREVVLAGALLLCSEGTGLLRARPVLRGVVVRRRCD